ncbi:MAG: MraY family glycosyltransferase [Bacillota bacterium]|nr:MraY family glycosyltransferase [Bacillota bacterium]
MEKIVAAIMVAFVIPLICTPLVKKLAFKIGAVDAPNHRKVHSKVMPRMGGLAIYLAFIAAVLVGLPLSESLMGLILGATIIVAIGILDDIRDISPKLKLLGQIAAALILVHFGVDVEFITNPFNGVIALGMLSIPVTIFWVIGITNAVNLIDGLDGLAAGTAIITAITLAIVAWTEGQTVVMYAALILAAATLGFLRFNFHPAQIFMGDSGSMFLGFVLATLSILGLGKSATVISIFIPILILGVPILDTAFAIVRRYLNHQPIFSADKEHLHHRLLAMGLTHKATVVVIYGIHLVMGLSAVLLTFLTTAQGVMILSMLSIIIILGAERLGIINTQVILNNQKKSYNQGGE